MSQLDYSEKRPMYLRKLLLFCIIPLMFGSLSAQKFNDLNNFKTGTFLGLEDGRVIDDYVIVRKKKRQIETYNKGKSKIISKIAWQTDRTFTLTTIKHVNVGKGCDKIGSIAYFTITNCNNGLCLMSWEQDGCGVGVVAIREKSIAKKD